MKRLVIAALLLAALASTVLPARPGAEANPDATFSQVSAGGAHTCGVKTDGTLACWGWNKYGRATPPAGSFSQVSAGGAYTCGLKTDGTVACWGNNEYGQATPPKLTPTPTPTPSPTPTAVPTPAATRTLQWNPGWHNAVWTGADSTPEEAFECAEGKYAAAYRYTTGGWQGYFPNLPDSSTMTELDQYDAFLILITESVSCPIPVEAAPGANRTLEWAVGWQNVSWTGEDDTAPEEAFACAEGKYAAAYRYTTSGWGGYFPNLPDSSTMTELDQYDAFFILVTAPVSCSMPIVP